MLHIATTEPRYVTIYEHITGVLRRLAATRKLWLRRRAFLKLAELDERTLQDIGLSRADLYNAAELPLEMNASLAAFHDARMRRAQGLRRRL